jgi:hypothetical protein
VEVDAQITHFPTHYRTPKQGKQPACDRRQETQGCTKQQPLGLAGSFSNSLAAGGCLPVWWCGGVLACGRRVVGHVNSNVIASGTTAHMGGPLLESVRRLGGQIHKKLVAISCFSLFFSLHFYWYNTYLFLSKTGIGVARRCPRGRILVCHHGQNRNFALKFSLLVAHFHVCVHVKCAIKP